MAAIAQGRKQEGAQSASFYFTANKTLTITDWEALEVKGKLKDVLTAVYEATDDNTALEVFVAAWAAAGGAVFTIGGGAGAGSCLFGVDGDGYPTLTANIGDADVFSVRIAVSYSASE